MISNHAGFCSRVYKRSPLKRIRKNEKMLNSSLSFLDLIGIKMANREGENAPRKSVSLQPEQGGEMNSSGANIIIKTEWKEAEKPELGKFHTVPNQGKMEGALHMQRDTNQGVTEQSDSNQMVQQSGAMQNLREFLQQSSSQNMAKPEQLSFPPLFAASNKAPALKMRQMGEGTRGMLQKYWPLLPAPPSFCSSVHNLKQFSMANQPSDISWPIPPSTQLSMGLPNPAAIYPLRGFSDMSMNSSNRENEIMQYFIKQKKMAARPVDNEYPIMINAYHPAAFNYQLQAGISGRQESFYSNTNHPLPPGRCPVMLSNQTFFVPPPPVSHYKQQGPIQQFAGSMSELRKPLKENPRKKVKQIVKQEEDVLVPVHHYSPKNVMDQNSREFLESFNDFTGSSQRSSSSSSRPNRRHGKSNNAPLYSVRNKASDFHVDPILRAFAISTKKKGEGNNIVVNSSNISVTKRMDRRAS